MLQRIRLLSLLALATPCLARAQGQVVYSVDWKGPTIARPATGTTTPITEGDLLRPATGAPTYGPLPTPSIVLTGGLLGLSRYANCVGHPPGTPCGVEVDALSAGLDAAFGADLLAGGPQARLWFSVDEWALGLSGGPQAHPRVASEAPVGDSSADLFVPVQMPLGPTAPPFPLGRNVGVVDGNGLRSGSGFVYPGVGLVEPNLPAPSLPNLGDNIDALDIGFPAGFPATGVLFSLDSTFGDPQEGTSNSGSANFQGVRAADVLRVLTPGGTVVVYAQASALGLDIQGPGTDDLDALILHENGDFAFTPSQVPFDWLPSGFGGTRDMLLFSVRRGSAVIGRPDSLFGQPIEEGDILTTPLPTSMGGLSPFPGIFVPAESLGLRTVRSGTAAVHGDDLNAADLVETPMRDCNRNGVEDAVDIATGYSTDVNGNGIPDECEPDVLPYCPCPESKAPCANPDPAAGCANSTGNGGRLAQVAGSVSVGADDLLLRTTQLPPNKAGIHFMGGGTASAPFGDGLRCVVSGGQGLYRYPVANSGPTGMLQLGPGIASASCALFPPGGCIAPGDTWYFQCWYRDPAGPCGSTFNLSNGLRVRFGP